MEDPWIVDVDADADDAISFDIVPATKSIRFIIFCKHYKTIICVKKGMSERRKNKEWICILKAIHG